MEHEPQPQRKRDRYKRADLPTPLVLASVTTYGFRSWEMLTELYPWKVVWRAYQRDVDRGYLEYGSSVARPWLTLAGEEMIRRERGKVIGCGDHYPRAGKS